MASAALLAPRKRAPRQAPLRVRPQRACVRAADAAVAAAAGGRFAPAARRSEGCASPSPSPSASPSACAALSRLPREVEQASERASATLQLSSPALPLPSAPRARPPHALTYRHLPPPRRAAPRRPPSALARLGLAWLGWLD
eukprot:scaffold2418_cov296-Prasinococcus_capsulatus_cf.AAC.3